MCLRYKLVKDWIGNSELKILPNGEAFSGNQDTQPADLMPVVRLDEQGAGVVGMRRWGFQRRWPNTENGKLVTRRFNASAEELKGTEVFRNAFALRRCIVPMSSWYKWHVIDGKRIRVEISMRNQPLFYAAGLFEISADPDTGKPVDSFTIVTVKPDEQLGTENDRAPLVLRLNALEAWYDSGWLLARALIQANPLDSAFYVRPAPLNVGCVY